MGKHDIAETYTMLGITPEEFLEDHGGDNFDFAKVKLKFGDMCHDFANALDKGEPNMGVQFASIIIYTVGPQSRKVKTKMNDKVWVFRFPYKGVSKDSLKIMYNTVCVSTYKNDENEYKVDLSQGYKLRLSVKHATLLSIDVLNRVTDLAMTLAVPVLVMSPLAASIFSRLDINAISMETSRTPAEILKQLNSSCQSGGHYLGDSTVAIAAVAAIMSTSGLRAKNKHTEANSIVTKTIKQYLAAKKEFNEDEFVIFARYATGGLPTGKDAKSLLSLFNACRDDKYKPLSAYKSAKAAETTDVTVLKKDLEAQLGPGATFTESNSGSNIVVIGSRKPPTAKEVKRDARIMSKGKDTKPTMEDIADDTSD